MNNKIKKIDEIGENYHNVEGKINEIIGMVNEHTDKINEIIKKLSDKEGN